MRDPLPDGSAAGAGCRPRTVGGVKALAFLEFLEERCSQVGVQDILAQLAEGDARVFDQGLRCEQEVPEHALFSLVRAAAEHQGVAGGPERLAFDYGSFLLLWIAERAGYREALFQVSSTFLGFARALNQLLVQLFSLIGHARTGLREAHISEITPDSFVLGFFDSPQDGSSDGGQDDGGYGRKIRLSIIMGMLDRAANDIYGIQVEFEKLDAGGALMGQQQAVRVHFAPASGDLRAAEEETAQAECSIMGLDPKSFYRLFPFHLVMDMDFAVVQVGSALQRMLPQLSEPGAKVSDTLMIHQPTVPWDLQCIQAILHDDLNSKLVLASECGLELEGALVKIHKMRRCSDGCLKAGDPALVFLGSPHMASLNDMKAHGLFLSDFAPQETAGEHILASAPRHAKANEALREAERSNAALKETLACTLANQETEDGACTPNIDSAANMILRLLDNLIMGGDVAVEDVLEVRNALLRGGTNLWRPLDVDVRALDADQEVNEALTKLLGAGGSTSNAPADDIACNLPHGVMLASILSGGSGSPTGSKLQLALPISRSKSVSLAVYKRSGTDRSSPISSHYGLSRPLTQMANSRGSQELTYETYYTRQITPNDSAALPGGSFPSAVPNASVPQHRPEQASACGPDSQRGAGPTGTVASLRAGMSAVSRSLAAGHRESEEEIEALHRHLVVNAVGSAAAGRAGAGAAGAGAGAGGAGVRKSNSWLQAKLSSVFGCLRPSAYDCDAEPAPVSGSGYAAAPAADTEGVEEAEPPRPPTLVAHVRATRRMPRRSVTENRLLPPSGLRRVGTSAAGPDGDAPAGMALRSQPLRAVPIPAVADPRACGALGAVGNIANVPLPHDDSPRSSGRVSGLDEKYEQGTSTLVDPKPLSLRLLYQPSDKLVVVLKKINDWQFDAFELEQASCGRPLSCLAFHLMKRMELIKRLSLSETRLARFLIRIEEGYGSHPYHSRTHAADVLRSLHILMTRGGILAAVQRGGPEGVAHSTDKAAKAIQVRDSSIKLLTVYLSAIIHDYEHRGVNNDFLVRSSDVLALRYNDMSPLENHHVSAAFMLMQQAQYSFLPAVGLNKQDLRKDIIDLVLATDMKQHFALTGTFRSRVASWHPAVVVTSGKSFSANERSSGARGEMRRALTHASHANLSHLREGSATIGSGVVPPAEPQPWDHETLMLVLKMTLKAADLGHLTSSLEVHKQWVSRLEEELFRQGDQERALGQTVSPLMDRTKTGIQKSQCGFFAVVAQPLFQGFAQAFPLSNTLLSNLNSNHEHWKEMEATSTKTG